VNSEDLGDLSDQADKLGVKVDDLGVKVDRQTKSLVELGQRQTRTEQMSTRTAVAAVIAIAVLAGGSWLGYRQVVSAAQLSGVVEQQRIANQQLAAVVADQRRVTEDALCPVFALLIGGYDPSTRPPGEAREQYERTFQTFRDSYDALRCTAQLVPPRSPGS
jgi:hypothetical protein